MKKPIIIGFIGAGNIAHAMISGLISQGVSTHCIKISDTNKTLLSSRQSEFEIEVFTSNTKLATQSDVLILAVKPHLLSLVCNELKTTINNPLILSIAAGVRSNDINRWLGNNKAIVRVIPNTPAVINQGISALFANKQVSVKQYSTAQNIINSIGQCLWVEDETMLDAVTAISGSGPAYFFLMLESMIKTGTELGLDTKTAKTLSIQTALGATMMANNTTTPLNQLRENVTSPNGTTQAAIKSFQQQNFEHIVSKAINAAFDRAKSIAVELSDK